MKLQITSLQPWKENSWIKLNKVSPWQRRKEKIESTRSLSLTSIRGSTSFILTLKSSASMYKQQFSKRSFREKRQSQQEEKPAVSVAAVENRRAVVPLGAPLLVWQQSWKSLKRRWRRKRMISWSQIKLLKPLMTPSIHLAKRWSLVMNSLVKSMLKRKDCQSVCGRTKWMQTSFCSKRLSSPMLSERPTSRDKSS